MRAVLKLVDGRIIAALSVILFMEMASPAHADEARPLPSVTVSTVDRAEIIDRVPISGTLVAKEEVLVFPQVSGFPIETVLFDIGDTVQKGDVLAQLNSQTLEAQLAQAEAEFARAQAAVRQAMSQIESSKAAVAQADAALDRSEQLRKSGTATQATLDQAVAAAQTANATLTSVIDGVAVAESQRQQAEAQLDIGRLNLEHAAIVAPIDGLISARNVQIGSIAALSGEPNFRIITDAVIEVEAEIIETALGDVQLGDPVELDIAGIGIASGTVRLVSPTVDPISRLGVVRIALKKKQRLRTGLFAGGWLITDQRNALSVPSRAVLADSEGSYVLMVDTDGVIERRAVEAGSIWKDRREILNGLNADDSIIAKAGAFFADGDQIKPVYQNQATASGDEQ